MKDDGGPAFPVQTDMDPNQPGKWVMASHGMSLRDWFAGQAIRAMLEMAWKHNETGERPPHSMLAGVAYEIADAMLEARGK